MVPEAHVLDPVLLSWDQADRVAPEGTTDFQHLSPKMDLALLLDLADGDARVILNRWQDLGIGAQAGRITRRQDNCYLWLLAKQEVRWGRESVICPYGNVEKSPSSKAAVLLARGAYSQYVSTAKGRERRWRLFSTFPSVAHVDFA